MARERGDSGGRPGDYRLARIGAAAALTLVACLLMVLDVVVPGYHVDPVVLGIIVGAILGLLGLEGVSLVRGSGPK